MRKSIQILAMSLLIAASAEAATINYMGTISYDGSSVGDTLYVAALDTAGIDDVTILGLIAIEIGSPPFAQPYSIDFDNSGVSPQVFIASFLDVNGGGVAEIDGVDVFGWYDGASVPATVSSASSQSGLDFALPTGEIHGTITFAGSQLEARIDPSPDLSCLSEGFRPGSYYYSGGAYSIIGVYAGSYCVSADGYGGFGSRRICYGDPDCISPIVVTLTDGEIKTGIDFDFAAVKIDHSTWGAIKSRFR